MDSGGWRPAQLRQVALPASLKSLSCWNIRAGWLAGFQTDRGARKETGMLRGAGKRTLLEYPGGMETLQRTLLCVLVLLLTSGEGSSADGLCAVLKDEMESPATAFPELAGLGGADSQFCCSTAKVHRGQEKCPSFGQLKAGTPNRTEEETTRSPAAEEAQAKYVWFILLVIGALLFFICVSCLAFRFRNSMRNCIRPRERNEVQLEQVHLP
ncbi:uncharacterized protein LOC133371446 [Rhineura floridana]|uniref:uncharacterized protein LOC133371446 n=1 Tax=Rhineura floridana TaxID=261503 RepID=UPI002AC82042|nr:uncharacterized protein LOC133371446 [Rhineura floridana]